ncbi:MAG: prenyltransferase [Spirochaetales bacterium]|nr:prenyltransferase [Spirochaetales bacterium]
MKLTGTMRLPFLILGPACVLPGVATAQLAGIGIPWWEMLYVFLGAILAHIGVNVFNEYHDWKSGLDAKTVRTPFSGGSGTLQNRPGLATAALILGISATAAAAGLGLYFVLSGRLLLLAVGGTGVLIVALYTPWIVRRPLICLLAPGLGFGTCIVLGTHVALGAPVTPAALLASLIPLFLVSNLLLLNQFPDVEQDKSVGRRNIIIAYGRKTGVAVYGVFLLLCYAVICIGAGLSVFPAWSLLGLVTLPVAVAAFAGAVRFNADTRKLTPSLGLNVIVVNLTPVLTGIGILIG